MNIPLSWLKDFVEVNLPLEEIARVMTMAGLEVDEVRLLGLAAPDNDRHGFKFTGLSWPADKFVVAEIQEVNAHPDADRLVLCELDDGTGVRTILNLFCQMLRNLFIPFKLHSEVSSSLRHSS